MTGVPEDEPQRRTGGEVISRSVEGKLLVAAPRLVLADDQTDMLQTIVSALEGEFKIVGTADNGARAIELTTTLSPDVVVLDISMPAVNGLEAASRLRELGCGVRLVFLTVTADSDFVETALSLGALGYVLKPFLITDLAPAIWAAMQGNTFVSPAIHLH